jgi:hypothetical protein
VDPDFTGWVFLDGAMSDLQGNPMSTTEFLATGYHLGDVQLLPARKLNAGQAVTASGLLPETILAIERWDPTGGVWTYTLLNGQDRDARLLP